MRRPRLTSAFVTECIASAARELQLDRGSGVGISFDGHSAVADYVNSMYRLDQPLDFSAALLLQHAEGGSGNFCNQMG